MEPEYRPPFRLLYAGLIFAIVGNIAIATFNVAWGQAYMIAGNLAVVVICTGALFLIRARQKGRL
jgi:hypothetical protein